MCTKEDYTTHEQAHDLYDLGYPCKVIAITGLENVPCSFLTPPADCLAWANNTGIVHPTLEGVHKWLRVKKDIYIQVSIDFFGKYYGVFFDAKRPIGTMWNDTEMFASPEEALSAAIDVCIKKLKEDAKAQTGKSSEETK